MTTTPNTTITMRVQKIIQAHPELFNTDQNKEYTEKEAIQKIASMPPTGNNVQREIFEIRKMHLAICNLMDLGYSHTAIELAIQLMPRAEARHQYKVALDLCDRLIPYFFLDGNLDIAHMYRTLYDKYALVLKGDHETMMLLGETTHNFKYQLYTEEVELETMLVNLNQKLYFDIHWYHFYYYQCKARLDHGGSIEQVFLDAIEYFEGLHLQQSVFTKVFCEELEAYYLEHHEEEKAKLIQQKINDLTDLDY